jgi:hypothetical protein
MGLRGWIVNDRWKSLAIADAPALPLNRCRSTDAARPIVTGVALAPTRRSSS